MINLQLCKRLKLTILINAICKSKNPPKKMRCRNFSRILKYLFSARRPDLVAINRKKKKKNISYRGFSCSSLPQSEDKRKQKNEKIVGSKSEKNLGNVKVMVSWYVWNSSQRLEKKKKRRLEELNIWERIEIVQITALLWSVRIFRRVLVT